MILRTMTIYTTLTYYDIYDYTCYNYTYYDIKKVSSFSYPLCDVKIF